MSSILKVLVVSLLFLRANFLTAACGEEVHSLAGPPALAHRALGCTERQVILGCMEAGNMQPYFYLRKVQIVTQVRTFIDGLLPSNGPFLHGSVVVGSDWQPADHSRDAFKKAFVRIIRLARLYTVAPDSRDTDALSRFKQAVDGEFGKIVGLYMDYLLPVCTKMLHYGVEIRLHKYTFMEAICKIISDVEPHYDVASVKHHLHEFSLDIAYHHLEVAAG